MSTTVISTSVPGKAAVWAETVNMTLKEASLSRYPNWMEYKRHSWWLLPPIL